LLKPRRCSYYHHYGCSYNNNYYNCSCCVIIFFPMEREWTNVPPFSFFGKLVKN
jgi:hypothetical protein